jgi:thiol-disulfide isomerase/thioredoxin
MRGRKTQSKKKQNNGRANLLQLLIIFGILLLVGGTFAYKSFKKQAVGQTGKELLAQARKEGKPVYILFHSKNCAPCVEMEKTVKQVMPSFAERIVFVDVDVYDESEEELISEFGVQSIPTSVFLGKDGKIITGFVGVIPANELKDKLNKLVEGKL